jgi:hypothetical protein
MKKTDDLKAFKLFGLSLIQLMSLIALGGIMLTAVLVHYFPGLA